MLSSIADITWYPRPTVAPALTPDEGVAPMLFVSTCCMATTCKPWHLLTSNSSLACSTCQSSEGRSRSNGSGAAPPADSEGGAAAASSAPSSPSASDAGTGAGGSGAAGKYRTEEETYGRTTRPRYPRRPWIKCWLVGRAQCGEGGRRGVRKKGRRRRKENKNRMQTLFKVSFYHHMLFCPTVDHLPALVGVAWLLLRPQLELYVRTKPSLRSKRSCRKSL